MMCHVGVGYEYILYYDQCWGNLLLKVMHYNIVLLPKKVTYYVTFALLSCYFLIMSRALLFVFNTRSYIYSKYKSFYTKKCTE